ncbi:MAG TPA: LURP-one-related family protein [Actinomycetota bacterium]|nr:LURP-one-related family protein [Actinomycetota bacterium]
MNYVVEQKLTFAKPAFSVTDEAGSEVYRVEGKALRMREQLWIRDLEGREVAFVEQKGALRPSFEITSGGALLATMSPRHKLFKLHFVLTDARTGAETFARGNLSGYEYDFERNGAVVATVRKKRRWTDRYALGVSDGEDDVVYIGAVLVIDAFLAEAERRRRDS